ncbi:hypothetical protein A1O7_07781 [Cladophialophora yegresii CBS 114405]|uniref:Sfi1 spindle body domain-containing protein n=1 Tax=Cladophialophora yegresii CBS 114405 TaxID=1182544 RepID=W9VPG4_9EURO|nr:uncharacterized protein A1O7_07781 [Cladophialophora yegresii CBS 114405]EXJ57433.1 hypothetical protein A1O7_07781 [Cladophialophora yegresii CBS 114405]
MTPGELAAFASTVGAFSAGQIDRLYQLVVGPRGGVGASALREQWRSLGLQDGGNSVAGDVADDLCLEFIIDVADTDPDTPLESKFFEILDAANIALTTTTTTTSSPRPSSAYSIESIDENEPLWRQAVVLDNRRLVSQVIDIWQDRVIERRAAYEQYEDPEANAVADNQYRDKLAKRTIDHWRSRVQHVKTLEAMAAGLLFRRDATRTLTALILAERETVFVRERQRRSAARFLAIWRQKTALIREMEDHADNFRNLHAAQNVLACLSETRQHHEEAECRAVTIYEGTLARRVFNQWFAQSQAICVNHERAEAAADYFAAKHAFQKLRARAQSRLAQKEITQARIHLLCLKYFRKWRLAVRDIKEAKYNAAYKTMRRKVKENIARASLTIWREKMRRVRAMHATADEILAQKQGENARKMAHSAIVAMYRHTEETRRAESLADEFYHQTLVRRLGIFGAHWLVPARQILANQRVADEYRATRLATYTLSALRTMRNYAFRAKRLEEDADTLRQRNEKKRALAFLHRWRQAAVRAQEDGGAAVENSLVPATPAARRSQLLASTTPAYTPGTGLFGATGRTIDEEQDEAEEEEEEVDEPDEVRAS